MVIAAIANVILDPILIFGAGPIPALELNGAAMAALISRGSLFVGTLILMYRRLDLLTFKKPHAGELRRSWADVLHVGLPAASGGIGTRILVSGRLQTAWRPPSSEETIPATLTVDSSAQLSIWKL